MKIKEVEIAKEVIRSHGWYRFACGDVSSGLPTIHGISCIKHLAKVPIKSSPDDIHHAVGRFHWEYLVKKSGLFPTTLATISCVATA